jgi:hypothetical protein
LSGGFPQWRASQAYRRADIFAGVTIDQIAARKIGQRRCCLHWRWRPKITAVLSDPAMLDSVAPI